MRLYAITAFSFVFLLETTAYLLHESANTYHHECLPAACLGCSNFLQGGLYVPNLLYNIICKNVGLTSFPIVKAIDINLNYSTVQIDYSGNHLTAVPANAFSNIHPRRNIIYAQLYLSNNLISRIDLNAFNGIADRITYLNMDSNKLGHLPSALSKLSSLTELDIQNNPIRHINSAVTSALGTHLNILSIDFGHMSSWPVAINNLHTVSQLLLYNITMELNDINIFHGLTSLNNRLVLDYKVKDHGPNFHTIPPAVTRLSHLSALEIYGEVYCTCGLSYLAHWTLPRYFHTRCHGISSETVKHYITYFNSYCPA